MLLIAICFTACVNTKNESNSSTFSLSEDENLIEEKEFFPIYTYKVYEIFNENSYNNSFDQVLLNNPIDKKMEVEIQSIDISSTRSSQVFFDEYVEIWKAELSFSIGNLMQYLNQDELEKLEESQENWEIYIESNNQIDQKIMVNNDINLGTQYVSSSLLYLISEYRERVFHIKYMTMLVEVYVSNPVLEEQRTWNKFSID